MSFLHHHSSALLALVNRRFQNYNPAAAIQDAEGLAQRAHVIGRIMQTGVENHRIYAVIAKRQPIELRLDARPQACKMPSRAKAIAIVTGNIDRTRPIPEMSQAIAQPSRTRAQIQNLRGCRQLGQNPIPKTRKRTAMESPLPRRRMLVGAIGKVAIKLRIMRPAPLRDANRRVITKEFRNGRRAFRAHKSPDPVSLRINVAARTHRASANRADQRQASVSPAAASIAVFAREAAASSPATRYLIHSSASL